MERKVVSETMLILILVGVLNVPLTVAEVGVDDPESQFFNGDDVEPFSIGGDLWNFSDVIEWSRFAYVNDNSAEVVIGLSNTQPQSYDRLSSLIYKSGGEIVNTVSMGGETVALVVNMSVEKASSFVESVQSTDLTDYIEYIEPNLRFQTQLTPNDPDWDLQWGPRKIEADYAWNTTIGDPSVLVAVIDTGIDYNHSDLANNYVALGYDWVNWDADPMDDDGHGTHCAGIIAATLNNNIGIAGLAQVKIMGEKGLDSGGSGKASDIALAIIHAVDQGADILSNSWGGYSYSELIHDTVKYAQDHGVLVVAAAGNDYSNTKLYPAAYDEVVAVTATDSDDNPAEFTNFGSWVEVAAPGVDIYSTVLNERYENLSGTSMSCPHAAGVAALIWSEFPSLTLDEVRLRLKFAADDLGDPYFDFYYGYGRVNARRAVEVPSHDLLISDWKRPAYVEPGSSAIINTTVVNFGSSNETGITVQLRVNGSIVDSAYISYLENMKSVTVSYSWSPTVAGRYYVESYVVPVSGETVVENNVRSAYINVRVGKFIRVPEDCSTILEAADLASPGETIKVASGTYYERVSIDTSLKLVGEDRKTTVIDGGGKGAVLWVAADNVEIRGFTVRGSGNIVGTIFAGIALLGVKNCEVTNNTVTANTEGIHLSGSSNNTISGNNIKNRGHGIYLYRSSNNIISGNNVTNNGVRGISIGWHSNDNSIVGNNIANNGYPYNGYGIILQNAENNTIYHNNFTDNIHQASVGPFDYANVWDDGYFSGGNYWSDYSGEDQYKGPCQNIPGPDGIGDTPYIINQQNKDNYPLTPGSPHDTGIISITASETLVTQGYNLSISIEIMNYGANTETFNVTAYANTTIIQTKTITLSSRNSTTVTITWNTTGFGKGDYAISAYAHPVQGETYIDDNTYVDGIVTLLSPGHEVAVKDVSPCKTVVGQGYPLSIDLTAKNYGSFTETFNVTAYYNEINPIATKTITLTSGNYTTITFTWNTTGFAKGNYTISANASIVQGETDTGDNSYTDGTIRVNMVGDIMPEYGLVDIVDVVYVATHFGAEKGKPPPVGAKPYEATADINGDGIIDIVDIVIIAIHFGEKDP